MKRTRLILLALAVSCTFESETSFTVQNSCSDSVPCVTGTCEEGVCVDPDSELEGIIVEIVRSSDDTSGLTPSSWVFPPGAYSSEDSTLLALPATTDVIGTVRWLGNRIPARLRFVQRLPEDLSSITPAPLVIDTMPEPMRRGEQGEEFDYGVQLVGGARYDILVEPRSDEITIEFPQTPTVTVPALRAVPPLLFEDQLIDPGNVVDGVLRMDFEFPEHRNAFCSVQSFSNCFWRGRVSRMEGDLEVPVAGLQVAAVEIGTRRLVSSVWETDGDGHFGIAIQPDAAGYQIQVAGTAENGLLPTVLFSVLGLDDETLDLIVPTGTATTVSGVVLDEDDSPVANATISFDSGDIFDNNELLLGEFKTTATTDATGRYTADVLAGPYQVTITPPEGSRMWSVARFEQALGFTPEADFVVPAQTAVTGRLRTFNGLPGAGITVQARSRPIEMEGTQVAGIHRSRETVSTVNGQFELRLDAGVYDMVVRAPPSAAFGWIVDPDVPIGPDAEDPKSYQLELPVSVKGIVRDGEGEIVTRSLVRAYRVISDGDATRAVQVAETTTDENGNYRLFVSP